MEISPDLVNGNTSSNIHLLDTSHIARQKPAKRCSNRHSWHLVRLIRLRKYAKVMYKLCINHGKILYNYGLWYL